MKLCTARKAHTCNLCGEPIPQGHRYWRRDDPVSLTTRREHCNCEEYRPRVTAQPAGPPA